MFNAGEDAKAVPAADADQRCQVRPPSSGCDPRRTLRGEHAPAGELDRAGLLRELAAAAHGGAGVTWSLLFVRPDQLEQIDGRLGRAVGDAVLHTIARRLRAADPTCHLGRVSAETFVAARSAASADEEWAGRLVAAAGAPMEVVGVELDVSIGAVVVEVPGPHADLDDVLAAAELAAHRRLMVGRATIERVAARPGASDAPLLATAKRVAAALDEGEIRPAYQPVVDLQTMQAVGAEALARWGQAPAGLEAPEDFLDIVRVLGRSAELLDAVLGEACRSFASGPAADRGWWVSVNLDVQDCVDPTLPARVQRILDASGLRPERLVLEVSERAIPDPAVGRALQKLAALGVKLALDDFGSGWSSLAQIRDLPIDIIKIDRSVVASPAATDTQLVMATLALAQALGMATLAEGVEAGEDLLLLCLAECDYGQGFWWSEPDALDALIERFPAVPGAAGEDAFAEVFDMREVLDLSDAPGIVGLSDEAFERLVEEALGADPDAPTTRR